MEFSDLEESHPASEKLRMFKCCTCKEQKPHTDEGKLGTMARIGLFICALLLAHWIYLPSKVCKDCEENANMTGEGGFMLVAFLIVLAVVLFIGSALHWVK